MKYNLLLVFICGFILSCNNQINEQSSLLDFVPEESAIILKINNLSSFKSELKNNDFLNSWNKTVTYDSIQSQLKALAYLETTEASILAITEPGITGPEFVFVTPLQPNLIVMDSTANINMQEVPIDNFSFEKYNVDGTEFFSITSNNRLFVGSSPTLMKALLKNLGKQEHSTSLTTLYKTANPDKSISLFVKTKNQLVASLLKEDSDIELNNLSEWISLDLNTGYNYITGTGITVARDTTNQFVDLFRGIKPLVSTTSSFAPRSSDALLAYTFDNYDLFTTNQQRHSSSPYTNDGVFSNVEEMGYIYLKDQKVILIATYDAERITQYLKSIERNSELYQGNTLSALRENSFLNTYFDPLVKDYQANYYTLIGNCFLFASSFQPLQTIISNYNSGNTFEKNPVYGAVNEVLAAESNILFISNNKGLEHIIEDDFSGKLMRDFKRSGLSKYAYALQLVADDNFYHTNMVIQQIGKEVRSNTITPIFTVQLDGEVIGTPQFVKNHRNNRQEIVVQDDENNLYLISTEGKVLWKKPLGATVRGKIEQVDIYKNGRLQLAFTTDDQFLILDRNGKEVKPFNKTYKGGNLNPLAVFDYDGNKNYRFVVTQGSKILMYNSKGDIVKGFTYTDAESPVLGTAKHFRIGKKDYLVFKLENGSLKILNRLGKSRVNVKDKISFSENDVYLYRNKFTVTDKNGTLFAIDPNGKTTQSKFNLNEDHGMDATSKTLATMNDNTLTIKGRRVNMELGVYTQPRIFYIYDKIYVSTTDLQSQQVYLFDSNAKPIPNFPVFGSSLIDLEDIDRDSKLEFVSKDQENSLILYKMN